MRIAYVSPLNPEKSGISDYSEELLPYIGKYMEVDVFTTSKKISNLNIKKNFSIYEYNEYKEQAKEKKYQFTIYQMGNNCKLHNEIYELILQYPGIVVLHDYAIHHFMAEYTLENGNYTKYIEEMIYNYGLEGLELANKFLGQQLPPLWETYSMVYPLNKRIIDNAQAVITTSKFVEEKVKAISLVVPTITIPLHASEVYSAGEIKTLNEKYRNKYNYKEDHVLLGAFGFATPNKRIHIILEILSEIKKKFSNFTFIIAGETSPNLNINSLINQYNLKDNVTITGYLTLEDFKEYMIMSDICFNLRYPIQGESSASLIRMMGFGKPIFVSDVGPFSEFSDEVVIKVPIDEEEKKVLINRLEDLLRNEHQMNEIGNNARQYIQENCSLDISAGSFNDFLREMLVSETSNINLITNELFEKISENLIGINWGIQEKECITKIVNKAKAINWA